MHDYVIGWGAQVNQHQPLVHALSRTFKSMSIRYQVESGAPFHANRDFLLDNVIAAGGLQDVTASEHRNKRYYSTSRTRTHKRGSTCGQAALTETHQLLPLLRRASTITAFVRNRCLSTSAARNSSPSRWNALGASGKTATT